MSNSETSRTYSNYGMYTISNSLMLYLPDTEILIEKIGEKAFSYYRKNQTGDVVEKIIPSTQNELTIELAPIRPLNHPARRTEYFYLQFEKEIFLPAGSAASIFVQCPIEIGIFLIQNNTKDSLDWVSCNTQNSRFALYGPADSGVLCKYAVTPIVSSESDSEPYINAVIKIVIQNELHSGYMLNKILFPITEYFLYYSESKSVYDDILATMRKKLTVNKVDIEPIQSATTWTRAPLWESESTSPRLEMELD